MESNGIINMTPCLWKFCGGLIDPLIKRCYKYSRTSNLRYEQYVERKQMKSHRDLQTSWRDYSKSRSRKENDDGESCSDGGGN